MSIATATGQASPSASIEPGMEPATATMRQFNWKVEREIGVMFDALEQNALNTTDKKGFFVQLIVDLYQEWCDQGGGHYLTRDFKLRRARRARRRKVANILPATEVRS